MRKQDGITKKLVLLELKTFPALQEQQPFLQQTQNSGEQPPSVTQAVTPYPKR
jgi:hypothetical protein